MVQQGDLTRVLIDDHTIFADLLAYSIDAEDDFVLRRAGRDPLRRRSR